MLSQNGRFVVFLGQKYHYVLSDNSGLVTSLLSSQYRRIMYIDSEETYLKTSLTNDLEAYVSIKLKTANINDSIEREMAGYGFAKNFDRGIMSLKIKLKGTRYSAGENFSFLASSSALNRKYIIKVYEDISSTNKAQKAMLTPITVTADAVLLIGKILLVPFAGN